MKFATQNQANKWFDSIFMQAARIVEGDTWRWFKGLNDYARTYEGREWFKRERRAHTLHGAIYDMILDHCYRPHDWHQLLLEWPHKSKSDPNRLAYTRDERAGEADRQVVTTVGKYLARHFPDAPDHLIRDVVAKHTYGGSIKIVKDMEQMISAVIHGPASCMTKSFNIRCDDGVRRHPYAVYDPSLGWGMAVRSDGEAIMGRCLVWEGDGEKVFVRSYKRERGEVSHSGTDEAIEAYLRGLGYQRHGEWPSGTPLKQYNVDGGYLMPYIDGSTQRVDEDSFCIDDDGDIEADETSGTANTGNCTCEDCGARFNDDDEGGWTGPYEDNHVCQNCLDNDYTYAYSRRGNQYYIHNNDVIEVGGEYYDTNYLSDNQIVCLANGEYEHLDNTVWVESQQEYYHCDDDEICYDDYNNQYELRENCVTLRDGSMCHEDDAWQCYATDYWYSNDVDYVEIDGETYHPDDAPETEETNDTESI